jgi:hypothetical protein
VKQYANQNHVDAAKIRKALDQLTAQQQRVKELVQKRVAAQAAMIAAAVGHPRASALAEERASQVRALTDHWWVQWQNGPNWLDLDPTLPDAQPGKTMTAAQATATPTNYSDLGDELLHTVQIKVVIEVWKHGSVTEVPVLTQDLLPADLIGESVVLRQIPVHWPQDPNLFQERNPLERFKQTVLAQTEWLPVLSVGSKNVSKYSFNDYGDLTDSTMPGYVQNVMAGRVLAHKEEEAVEGLGKSIGGMLGGSVAHNPSPDEKAPVQPQGTQVTAEWINYEVRIPGKPVRTIRREMFDLVGPAARSAKKVPLPQMTDAQRLERGLKLLGETEILPLVSYLPPEFVLHLAVKDALANREALLSLFRIADSSDLKASVGLASKLTQFPVQLIRLAALARKKWSRFSDDVYLDRPNILSYYSRLSLNAKGQVLVREGYDIVANEVAVRSTRGTDAFFVRLEQGLLDTNAEAILAAARCGSLEKEPSCRQIENTSELFNVSRKRGTDWLLLESVRDPGWEHMELPIDVRTRVEQDLAAGYTVLVPKQMVRIESDSFVGWWRLNLRSGDTLGIGEAGGGQSGTESVLKNIVAFLPAILMLIVAKRCAQIHCPCWVIGGIAMMVMLFGWLAVGGEFVEGVVLGGWGDIGFGIYDFIKSVGECVDSWTEAGLKVGS